VAYGSEIAMQMFEIALDPDRMAERPAQGMRII